MLKIGLLGNANNNFSSICRYLRDRGVDAELLLFNDEHPHFHPSYDCHDNSYLSFTKQLSWGDLLSYMRGDWEQVETDLEPYDVIIGCGPAPAFVHRIGRRLDVFVPYGGDVKDLPVFQYTDYGFPKLSKINAYAHWSRYKLAKDEKAGIANTQHLVMMEDIYLPHVKRCGFKGTWHRLDMPMVYSGNLDPATIPKSQPGVENYPVLVDYMDLMRVLRNAHFPIIFNHARHVWKTRTELMSLKGTDKLLRGYAKFVHQHRDLSPMLVTCEYGPDFAASKALISELGISRNVTWLPILPRATILTFLTMADIGTNNFELGWIGCGAIFETLASGVPLMSKREDDRAVGLYKELYPVMNVSQPDEIAAAIADFVVRPDHYRERGSLGREWFNTYCVDVAVKGFINIINDRELVPREKVITYGASAAL